MMLEWINKGVVLWRNFFDKFYYKNNLKQIVGVVLAVVGSIIIIQVVPLKFWFFILGGLLIAAGLALFKIF